MESTLLSAKPVSFTLINKSTVARYISMFFIVFPLPLYCHSSSFFRKSYKIKIFSNKVLSPYKYSLLNKCASITGNTLKMNKLRKRPLSDREERRVGNEDSS